MVLPALSMRTPHPDAIYHHLSGYKNFSVNSDELYKTADGLVYCSANIRRNAADWTAKDESAMCLLPEGFRPSHNIYGVAAGGWGMVYLTVKPNGYIYGLNAERVKETAEVYISTLVFKAA